MTDERATTTVGWTPSDREIEMGLATTDALPPPPVKEVVPREPLRRRISTTARAYSPRAIAAGGSVMPLVILALLASVAQWDDIAFGLLLPFIRLDMGFDFQFMLTLQSAVGVVTTMLAPITGYIADRASRVRMVQAGALIGNVAAVVTGAAPSPGTLVAARVVGGFGPGLEEPARIPLIADHFKPAERVRAFTVLQAATVIGPALGLLGVYLIVFKAGMSWRVVMLGSGALSLVVTSLAFRLRDPVRGRTDRLAAGATAEEAAVEQKPVAWTEAWRTLRSITSLRRLWYATPFLTVAQTSIYSFLFFALQRRLAAGDVSGPGASILKSANGIFLIVGLPPLLGILALAFVGPVTERLMRERPGRILFWIGVVLSLQAAAMAGLLISPWLPVAYLMLFIVTALGHMIFPAQYTLLSAIIPPRVRAQGVQSIAPWRLLGFLLLPVTGALADSYGVTSAVMVLACVMVLGAVITATGGANVQRDLRAALAASRADEEAAAARKRGASKMIVCRDVDVHYDGTQVLFNVDLDVEEGELIALLGTNGAGKSTLLRAISGLSEASNGAVFLDGEDVTHKPAYLNARDGVVFLPGGRAVFPTLTVEENLRAGAWLERENDPAEMRARIDEVLDLFPVLRERLSAHAGDLSGGEQQMVALAQSFLMRPRLLMIDELSLGLAPAVVERLLEVVRQINARGTTVILVEQSVNVALTIARRAVFMDKGRIMFDGPVGDLLGRPDLVRSVFLGTGSATYPTTPPAARRTSLEERERVLATEDVSVSYGGVQALNGVSLEVRAGEIVGIIGPNGAGKTTLFDVISGFARADSGRVLIAGEEATDLAPNARARLGLTRSFQSARLFPSLTVRENLAVALERKLGPRNAVAASVWAPQVRALERSTARKIELLLASLGLEPYGDKFVNELSTGSRRLVDLACIMLAEPKVLLLDEPTSGLAQAEIEVLGPVVQRLARETGCGILLIEHDIPLVTAISDRMIAMELGAVISDGDPATVTTDPRVVGSYLTASGSVINRSGDLFTTALSALGVTADAARADEE